MGMWPKYSLKGFIVELTSHSIDMKSVLMQ